MKVKNVKENIVLVGKKVENNRRKMDYYLRLPDQKEYYLYSGNYTESCYKLCKSGIRLQDILYRKSRKTDIMTMVDHLHYILPYMMEYLGIQSVKKEEEEYVY